MSVKGRKHSEDACRRKSERMKGRTFTPETLRRLQAARLRHSSLSDDIVRRVFELAGGGVSFHRIAIAVGISVPTVARITHRRTWAWVVIAPEIVAKAQEWALRRRNEKGKPGVTVGALRGEDSPQSKLTADQVREIRRMKESGMGRKEIAQKFNVTAENVCRICHRLTWKHI